MTEDICFQAAQLWEQECPLQLMYGNLEET